MDVRLRLCVNECKGNRVVLELCNDWFEGVKLLFFRFFLREDDDANIATLRATEHAVLNFLFSQLLEVIDLNLLWT
jgi:hypothetical protein